MVRIPSRRAVRNMRHAISPRLATRRLRITCPALHAEHAEAPGLERRVARRCQRQREYAPGITGVYHPVVPEPRRRIIRMALALVLLADRVLEGLLFGSRPLAPAALQLLALYGREHTRGL